MIDAHVHFWRYTPSAHAWIGVGMERIARDFLPSDLEPHLRAAGLTGCTAVQARSSLEETRFLLDLAARHPVVTGVVGWVDLCAPDLVETLAELTCDPRLVGVRHLAQDEPDARFLVRPDVLRGIGELARFDLAFEILVREPQWSAALELVRALPSQRFVLDHLGKPPIAAQRREPWSRWIRELAREPNVSAKVSGLVTEAAPGALRRDDFAYFVDTAVSAFGRERLAVGSDWPVCLLAARYEEVLQLERALLASS